MGLWDSVVLLAPRASMVPVELKDLVGPEDCQEIAEYLDCMDPKVG